MSISPTFWHDLIAQTPTRLIAISGTVAVIVQLLKKADPDLVSGKVAVALNLVLSIVGVFVGMNPANVFSQTTLSQLAAVVAAAGGFHGVYKTFFPGKPASHSTPSFPAVPGGVIPAIAVMMVLCLTISGCSVKAPTPATAPSIYQTGAQAMDDFATDLQQAQGIEKSLHTGGAIPDATHQSIQAAFSTIANYGTQIDALILAQASAATITDRINAAISSLAGIAIIASNLDAATSAQVNSSIAALKLLLTNLLPIFAPTVSIVAPNPQTLEVSFGPRNYRNTRRGSGYARSRDLQPGEGGATRAVRFNNPYAYRNTSRRC